MFFKKKTASERIKIADKKRQKLRDKRSKLEKTKKHGFVPREEKEKYEKKINKINNKIHVQSLEIDLASKELKRPVNNKTTNNTKINAQISFNKNITKKSVEFHGHYHANKSKSDKK